MKIPSTPSKVPLFTGRSQPHKVSSIIYLWQQNSHCL